LLWLRSARRLTSLPAQARKAVEETILRILDETAEKVGKSLYKVKEKR
jgi:hypothetical protein